MPGGPPFKIVFVIEGLGRGGTERSLGELLPHLRLAKIQPVVVYLQLRSGVHEEVARQGIDLRLLASGRPWTRLAELRRIIRIEKPELVHTMLYRADILGRLAAAGTPAAVMTSLVSTPYAAVRFRDPAINRRTLRALQHIDGWTGRHLVRHFHAVSQAAAQAAIEALGIRPERVTVVHRGRDPARLGSPGQARRTAVRAGLGLPDDALVVVNVGRHEHAKGQLDLIVAIASLAMRHPALHLVIAGREGTLTGRLQEAIREARLDGRVHLVGHREDVPDILAAADLFAFPSLYEGLPGAVIEAMALGLPIVASDIAPVREVIEAGGNALLVPPGSAAGMAEALAAMIEDRERASVFGKRSREIFLDRFTLEHSAARMIELYRRIAANQGPGASRPMNGRG